MYPIALNLYFSFKKNLLTSHLPLRSKILMCFKFIDATRVLGEKLHHPTVCAVSPRPTSAIRRAGVVTEDGEFSAMNQNK